MKIAILMCHYGDKLDTTKKCIESFIEKDNNFDEIIISNNNKDHLGSDSFNTKVKVTVLNNGKNLGYPGGINMGLDYVLKNKIDYVFIVNNDCLVLNPFLKKSVDFAAKNKNVGMVFVPLKFKKRGEWVYDIGGRVNWFGKLYHDEVKSLDGISQHEISFAGCFLLKKEVVEKVGMMDEDFFLYYDDIDYCIKASKKNFSIFLLPISPIYHGVSETVGVGTPRAAYHQTRSAIIYAGRHLFPSPIFILFHWDLLITSLKRIRRRPSIITPLIKGYRDGFLLRTSKDMVS